MRISPYTDSSLRVGQLSTGYFQGEYLVFSNNIILVKFVAIYGLDIRYLAKSPCPTQLKFYIGLSKFLIRWWVNNSRGMVGGRVQISKGTIFVGQFLQLGNLLSCFFLCDLTPWLPQNDLSILQSNDQIIFSCELEIFRSLSFNWYLSCLCWSDFEVICHWYCWDDESCSKIFVL